MCGRFTLAVPADEIADLFDVDARLNLPPRYNIAPTQQAPVVRATEDGVIAEGVRNCTVRDDRPRGPANGGLPMADADFLNELSC